MRNNILSIVLLVLLGCANVAWGQGQAPKPTKKNLLVITGLLVNDDGSPVPGSPSTTGCSVDAKACIVVVRVTGSRATGQGGTKFEIETIRSARGVEPNKAGRFAIQIERDALPKEVELMLATFSLLSGIQPLELNRNPVVFKIDDKTQKLDLGRITLTNR